MKTLPDLHKQAMKMKNLRRLKHDGGRAWIKDSQLFEARKGVNEYIEHAGHPKEASAESGSKK